MDTEGKVFRLEQIKIGAIANIEAIGRLKSRLVKKGAPADIFDEDSLAETQKYQQANCLLNVISQKHI